MILSFVAAGNIDITINTLLLVSKEFKSLALTTPDLWNFVDFSMSMEESKLNAIWATMRKFAKKPAAVNIRDIGDYNVLSLSKVPLNDVIIRSLTLEIVHPRGIDQLKAFVWTPSPENNQLQIESISIHTGGGFEEMFWDDDMLVNIPAPHILALKGFQQPTFPSVDRVPWFRRLETLRVDGEWCLWNTNILNEMTELTSLEFAGDSLHPVGTVFKLPKLKHLKAEVIPTWFQTVECPQLTILELAKFEPFATATPSPAEICLKKLTQLTSIKVEKIDDCAKFAAVVPQVECLYFSLAKSPSFGALNPLANLKMLSIHDPNDLFTVAMLKTLLIDSKGKRLLPALKLLHILRPAPSAPKKDDWTTSTLLPGPPAIFLLRTDDHTQCSKSCKRYTVTWN